jgi:hypothetical protein
MRIIPIIQMFRTPLKNIPDEYPYFVLGSLLILLGIFLEAIIKPIAYVVGLIGIFLWIYEFNFRHD